MPCCYDYDVSRLGSCSDRFPLISTYDIPHSGSDDEESAVLFEHARANHQDGVFVVGHSCAHNSMATHMRGVKQGRVRSFVRLSVLNL